MLLDKEAVKELLYLELQLTREIGEVIKRLKKAGHDFKRLGETLEKDPLLGPLTPPGGIPRIRDNPENRISIDLLVECSRTYSFTLILSELVNLRRKRSVLEDVQMRLGPVRNPDDAG